MVSYLAVVFASLIFASQEPAPRTVDDVTAKLQKLQLERIETLERCVKQFAAEYSAGRATMEDLLPVLRELLNAKLEMAASTEDKVRLLESEWSSARYFQARAEARVPLVRDSSLRWKAHALSIEIELVKNGWRPSPERLQELLRPAPPTGRPDSYLPRALEPVKDGGR